MLPAFAALAAAGAILAAPPEGPALGTGDVRLEAEQLACDAATGRCRLEGRVLLQRGQVSLRADRATYTPATGEVEATGNVLLVDAARVVSAHAVRAVLGGAYEAEDVVAWMKDGPVRLSDVEARGPGGVGKNRLHLSGRSLSGSESGPLRLDGARVTLCDCGDGPPSWELRSRHAEVVAGDHADLSWPVLWITPRFLFVRRPVPVFAFPWLRVPLSERQSGLLFPAFSSTGATGLAVEEALFLTLGRSADATISAGYAFGGGGAAVRGPEASVELRWAPAVDASGRLEVAWLQDLKDESSPVLLGTSGARVAILGEHAQLVSDRTSLRMDLGLFSDPLYVRDFNPERLLRDAFYRRSSVLLSYRREDAVGEAFAAYHAALAPASVGSAGVPAGRILLDDYGAFGGGLPVFHRWPSASATLLPVSAGPILASARAGIARFAPPSGVTSDSGTDGLGPGDRGWLGASPAETGELDGRWEAGERLAVTRADARAELSLPLLLGRAVSLEPYVRGAALGYAWDASLDPAASAWAVAGAVASAEISRPFGELRHVIEPRVEWRWGSGAAGPAPAVPSYDEWDRLAIQPSFVDSLGSASPPRRVLRAAPAGEFQQLRVGVETRLASPSGDLARLAVGQDVDLAAGRIAETWFSAFAHLPPLVLDAHARLDALRRREDPLPASVAPRRSSWLEAFTSLRGTVSLADHRGDSLGLGLLALGPGASGDLVAGVDALFDPQPAPTAAVAQATLSARAVLGPATLGYEAQFPGRPLDVPACPGDTGTRSIGTVHVQQQVASFTWSSPCRCFRARFRVAADDCGRIGYSASIDLSRE